ncbi:MAG: succinate--CoA ligase subunit alpha [Deltaproteobacteria bacterium]|nr:succinate--CoA ligase subunit alpha [Deltaproteobacteria bacterium]
MAILIDKNTVALVQGITGAAGSRYARFMRAYGTRVAGGVTPGKGGSRIFDFPVFDSVREAKKAEPGINATVLAVPGRLVKDAIIEAVDAGVKIISVPSERIPQHDMLEVIAYAKERGATVLGGNSAGIISPGKCVLGGAGGKEESARSIFTPGHCGVISRSGGQRTTVCYYLSKGGIGQSTAVATGGDAFVATNWRELLELFERDRETHCVVAFGEIGATMEEDAAELILKGGFTKPLVAFIAGKHARPGIRFGHAGAMITRGKGYAESKVSALRKAGVTVVDHLDEIVPAAKEALAKHSEK